MISDAQTWHQGLGFRLLRWVSSRHTGEADVGILLDMATECPRRWGQSGEVGVNCLLVSASECHYCRGSSGEADLDALLEMASEHRRHPR